MFHNLTCDKKTYVNRVGRKLSERDIESYGGTQCKKKGWDYEKFVSPEKRGVPDRMITIPCTDELPALIVFVELKKPGEKATRLQTNDHLRRRRRGCMVFVVDSKEQFEFMIAIILAIRRAGRSYVPSSQLPRELLT